MGSRSRSSLATPDLRSRFTAGAGSGTRSPVRALVALSALALAALGHDASAAPQTATSGKGTASNDGRTAPAKASSATGASGTKASSKPAAKPSSNAPTSKNASSSSRPTRTTENGVRRQVAGGPTYDDAAMGADTPELRALYAAERELFPPASPQVGAPWPSEHPFPVATPEDRPRVHASGLPPAPPPSTPPLAEGPKDLAWLAKLDLPDLPVRFEPRVVRYLEFFKDDPRGRVTLTTWLRRSGRYRDTIKKTLRAKGLPEDLLWLSMIESGFDPVARSPVGAMGLWQFMPDTGKVYGLSQDRWNDQRLALVSATEAAADHLSDLHRRFGSWELAMAAYNMGYGGVLSAVRRYNTNDYWALSKLEGSLPWETTLYVPKIIAAAVVAKNLAAFGYQDVTPEPALEGEEVLVAPGTALATVAQACGAVTKDVEVLNPELRASRTPPAQADWPVKVPAGKAAGCSQNLAKSRPAEVPERYVVRFGESLEQIAQARHVAIAKIVELNGIAPGEMIRGGTVLLVPKEGSSTPEAKPSDPKKVAGLPVVVVPQDVFVYPDRKRVFYRVQVGDTVKEVASTFHVSPDDLRRWNDIDTSARLVETMTLQIFAPSDVDLAKMVVLREGDVRVVVAGTEDFFNHWEEKGRKRTVVTAKAGETIEAIGKRHNVSAGLMERINRRGRSEVLSEGERVVVWAPGPNTPPSATGANATASTSPTLARPTGPETTPPLGEPPAPDLLPPLPTFIPRP